MNLNANRKHEYPAKQHCGLLTSVTPTDAGVPPSWLRSASQCRSPRPLPKGHSWPGNEAAMTKMMAAMNVKPSGDVDRDFVAMMIPHHQGAIDMAQAFSALRSQRATSPNRSGNHRGAAAGNFGGAAGAGGVTLAIRRIARSDIGGPSDWSANDASRLNAGARRRATPPSSRATLCHLASVASNARRHRSYSPRPSARIEQIEQVFELRHRCDNSSASFHNRTSLKTNRGRFFVRPIIRSGRLRERNFVICFP